jgi:hypothetical protein
MGVVAPLIGTTSQPVLVPETNCERRRRARPDDALDEGANVDELVNGLHAIGTTARDVVAILQAIKAEGGHAGRIGGPVNGNKHRDSVGLARRPACCNRREDRLIQQEVAAEERDRRRQDRKGRQGV